MKHDVSLISLRRNWWNDLKACLKSSFLFTFLFVFTAENNSEAREKPPVFLQGFVDQRDDRQTTPWKAPNYKNQGHRIGYTKTAFAVPKSMEGRVGFWKDIYAKYTSNQGLLHDAREINLIYEVVDLPTEKSTGLAKSQVQKLRRKTVDDAKDRIRKRLKRLQSHFDQKKSVRSLSKEDLRIWNALSKDKSRKKFTLASRKNRLRLQLGQKDHFANGIFYSGRYLKQIEEIFARYNLPKELTRLPFVESSFNILAQSKVGASGIWQFMRYTGRSYLKINRYVDERNHPIKATVAAAKMFKWIYSRTESWPLAVTGYNYGPSGIRRLAKKHKTKDLSLLIKNAKNARFGFASQNFFASFLAALEVEKNAHKYFSPPKRSRELPVTEIKLKKPIMWKNLIKFFDGNAITARVFNPHFSSRVRRGLYPIPRNYRIHVPKSKKSKVVAAIKRLPARARTSVHRVRRGETLTHIASRFGVSLRSLIATNRIRRANTIRVGQLLKIPD